MAGKARIKDLIFFDSRCNTFCSQLTPLPLHTKPMTNQEALNALKAALTDHISDDVKCLEEEGLLTDEQFWMLLTASVQVAPNAD